MPSPSLKKFQAVLKPDHTALKWTIARVPRDVTASWPEGRRLRVKGSINGFAFRTSLFSTGKGGFILLVNKRMQAGAGVALGSLASFTLEPDTEERTIEAPPELAAELAQVSSLRRWFDRLNYSTRKYVTENVTQVKSATARHKRAAQMAELLLSVMEGERETPPILEAAFARTPLARKGWHAMTPLQRRGHLMGIFYYRSPESRERRTRKAIEEALRIVKPKHED
jgi:uncharacterized protein YdeI (YjbR/CyaY-like superfamily)